jgi:ribosomal protein L37AE/L43A
MITERILLKHQENGERKMEVIGQNNLVYICPECEGKMYLLPGSMTSIYVCRECGYSADTNSYDLKNGEIKKKIAEESENECLQKGKNCISNIFPHAFMKKHTKFENIVDFLNAGGFLPKHVELITFEIFKRIRGYKLDQYVKKNTNFNNWDEMFDSATGRYLMI